MKPTTEDLRVAKDTVRDWADSFSDVSWQDLDTLNIYHLPRELDATGLIDRVASAIAAEREKAAKGDINAALAELREMFPNEFVAIETEIIQRPDGTMSSFVQVSAYRQEDRPMNWTVGESGETLSEAMAAIRAGDKG